MEKNNIISWKNYRGLFFLAFAFYVAGFILLSLNLIKNYNLENLIGTITYTTISTIILFAFLFPVFFIWQIEVLSDKIIYRKMFGKTIKYNFAEIALYKSLKYLGILNKNGRTIFRVSFLVDNYDFLTETYKIWENINKPLKIKNNTAKCNFYVRNFAIFFLIFSFVCGLCSWLCAITTDINNSGMLGTFILFLSLASLSLMAGIFSLLLYKVWKIEIVNDKLVFRNFLGKTKIYDLPNLSMEEKIHTFKLFNDKKKISKIFIHLTDNIEMFEVIKYKKFT